MALLGNAILNGVGVGCVYALFALGIVVLYTMTGVPSFAIGATGTVLVFVEYTIGKSVSVMPALGAVVVIAAILGIVMYAGVIWPKRAESTPLTNIIRTMGLYLLLEATTQAVWGGVQPATLKSVVPAGHLGPVYGLTIPDNEVVAGIVLITLVVGGSWFLRGTRYGLMYRALAERPDLAEAMGIRVSLLSAAAWSVVSIVALITAMVTAPSTFLTTDMMDISLLYAFVSAIIGGLGSVPGALCGGLFIGITTSVVDVYLGTSAALMVIFTITIIILLVRPSGFFGSRSWERL